MTDEQQMTCKHCGNPVGQMRTTGLWYHDIKGLAADRIECDNASASVATPNYSLDRAKAAAVCRDYHGIKTERGWDGLETAVANAIAAERLRILNVVKAVPTYTRSNAPGSRFDAAKTAKDYRRDVLAAIQGDEREKFGRR